MVRVAGKDLLRAIKLFQQHAANQEMRPSHSAEREDHRRTIEDGCCQPIGTADRKTKFRGAAIAPLTEVIRQFAARPSRSPLVEGDEGCFDRQCFEDQLGFARLRNCRRQALFDFELRDRRRRNDTRRVKRLQIF
jgi:hypothetical protein